MGNSQEKPEASVLDYVAVMITIPATLFAMYSSFLVFGGLFGTVLGHEGMLRWLGALGLSVIFPFVTGASAFTQHSAPVFSQRLQRLFAIMFALTVGSAVLVGLFMTSKTVEPMYTDPNWFISKRDASTGFPAQNRKYSAQLANALESMADAAGTYYKPNKQPSSSAPAVQPYEPPAPTRPRPTR